MKKMTNQQAYNRGYDAALEGHPATMDARVRRDGRVFDWELGYRDGMRMRQDSGGIKAPMRPLVVGRDGKARPTFMW